MEEEEFIDVLSEDLKVIKTSLKSEAHKNGWLHGSVHIWFYTIKGDILIQKRSKDKIAFPNVWDVSVAGHISAGETAMTSALREIEEEIGLKVSELELIKIGTFKEKFQHASDYIDNEVHQLYLAILKSEIQNLKIQIEEVSEIKLISIDEFKKERNKASFEHLFASHKEGYYSFVIKELEKRMNL